MNPLPVNNKTNGVSFNFLHLINILTIELSINLEPFNLNQVAYVSSSIFLWFCYRNKLNT